jgi:hypothetical protein
MAITVRDCMGIKFPLLTPSLSGYARLFLKTALFAGIMVGLAQMLDSHTNSGSTWEAARIFIYGSIITNLTGTMLALLGIVYCMEVEGRARHMAFYSIDSLPYLVARHRESIPADLRLINRTELLIEFGMMPYYHWVEQGQRLWLAYGMHSTFLALVTWIWLSQTHTVFGVLMVPIVLGYSGLFLGFTNLGVRMYGVMYKRNHPHARWQPPRFLPSHRSPRFNRGPKADLSRAQPKFH